MNCSGSCQSELSSSTFPALPRRVRPLWGRSWLGPVDGTAASGCLRICSCSGFGVWGGKERCSDSEPPKCSYVRTLKKRSPPIASGVMSWAHQVYFPTCQVKGVSFLSELVSSPDRSVQDRTSTPNHTTHRDHKHRKHTHSHKHTTTTHNHGTLPQAHNDNNIFTCVRVCLCV